MINVPIDGIWCKKCNDMHPTLFWHEKYNDYELDRRKNWERAVSRFLKEDEPMPLYQDSLPIKGLKEVEVAGGCVVCGCSTFFKTLETNEFVCCDECKYKHLKK